MKRDKRDYVISVGRRREDRSRYSKSEKRDIDGEFKRGKLLNKSRRHSYYTEYGNILRKWIYGQVGRNWDEVYSDFKAICKTNNLYNVDINWYVELDSQLVDGKLINSKGEETSWWRWRDTLYVDKNGILEIYKGRPRWRKSQEKENENCFWIDKEKRLAAVKIYDVWYIAQYYWFEYSQYLWKSGEWKILHKKTMNKKEKRKYGVK